MVTDAQTPASAGGTSPQQQTVQNSTSPYQQYYDTIEAFKRGQKLNPMEISRLMENLEGKMKDAEYGRSFWGAEKTRLMSIKAGSLPNRYTPTELNKRIDNATERFDYYDSYSKEINTLRQKFNGIGNQYGATLSDKSSHPEVVKQQKYQNNISVPYTINGVGVQGYILDKEGKVKERLGKTDAYSYVAGKNQYQVLDNQIAGNIVTNPIPQNVANAGSFVDTINKQYEAQVLIANDYKNGTYTIKLNPKINPTQSQIDVLDKVMKNDGFVNINGTWTYSTPIQNIKTDSDSTGKIDYSTWISRTDNRHVFAKNETDSSDSERQTKDSLYSSNMSVDSISVKNKIQGIINRIDKNPKSDSSEISNLGRINAIDTANTLQSTLEGRYNAIQRGLSELETKKELLNSTRDINQYEKYLSDYVDTYNNLNKSIAQYNADTQRLDLYSKEQIGKSKGEIGDLIYPISDLIKKGGEGEKQTEIQLAKFTGAKYNDKQSSSKNFLIDDTGKLPIISGVGILARQTPEIAKESADLSDSLIAYSRNRKPYEKIEDLSSFGKDVITQANDYRLNRGIQNLPSDTLTGLGTGFANMKTWAINNPERAAVEGLLLEVNPTKGLANARMNTLMAESLVKNPNKGQGYLEGFGLAEAISKGGELGGNIVLGSAKILDKTKTEKPLEIQSTRIHTDQQLGEILTDNSYPTLAFVRSDMKGFGNIQTTKGNVALENIKGRAEFYPTEDHSGNSFNGEVSLTVKYKGKSMDISIPIEGLSKTQKIITPKRTTY